MLRDFRCLGLSLILWSPLTSCSTQEDGMGVRAGGESGTTRNYDTSEESGSADTEESPVAEDHAGGVVAQNETDDPPATGSDLVTGDTGNEANDVSADSGSEARLGENQPTLAASSVLQTEASDELVPEAKEAPAGDADDLFVPAVLAGSTSSAAGTGDITVISIGPDQDFSCYGFSRDDEAGGRSYGYACKPEVQAAFTHVDFIFSGDLPSARQSVTPDFRFTLGSDSTLRQSVSRIDFFGYQVRDQLGVLCQSGCVPFTEGEQSIPLLDGCRDLSSAEENLWLKNLANEPSTKTTTPASLGGLDIKISYLVPDHLKGDLSVCSEVTFAATYTIYPELEKIGSWINYQNIDNR